MTWMAWRLQRSVYLFALAVSLVLIGLTIANGLHLQMLLHHWRGAPCHGGNGFDPKYQRYCQSQLSNYIGARNSGLVVHLMAVVPAGVVGVVLGANLVAGELSQKTVRSAWTQSVTRKHWFATKVLVGLVSILVMAVPLCLTATWWLDASMWTPRISTNSMTYAGLLPAAVGVFAFALATAVGVILRRPGWAVAMALSVLLAVMWTMQFEVRPSLVPVHIAIIKPVVVTKGFQAGKVPTVAAPDNSWVLFSGFAPLHSANIIPSQSDEERWQGLEFGCETAAAAQQNEQAATASQVAHCQLKNGLQLEQLYVADNEYWKLQIREGGLYLVGATLLFSASLVLVRRSRA